MRLLFIGDVIGRSGRAAIAEHVPRLRQQPRAGFRGRQWRKRRRRLRHHRKHRPGVPERGNRLRDARQSRLRPARGAGLHRARAPCPAADQLSAGHAGARVLALRDRRWRTRAGDERHGPRLHGRARRSLRGGGKGAVGLSAGRRPATPSSSTSTPRRRARNRLWPISATAGSRSPSAPIPMCRPPTGKSCPTARRSRATPA